MTNVSRLGGYAGFSLAVMLVVVLAVQNHRLEARFSELVKRVSMAQPGYRVPWATVQTLAGESVTLGAPESGAVQVLFFYTTTCPHCRATVAAWNDINERANDATVLGIQLDSPDQAARYRDAMRLRYAVAPVDSAMGRRIVDWYRASGVPLTLVIGSDCMKMFGNRGECVTGCCICQI